MKKYIPISFLLFCSFFLVNCDEDSFSTVVEVDLSEYGNQLVIQAPFLHHVSSTEPTNFSAILFKSNDILNDTRSYDIITDATVDIYEGDSFLTSLTQKSQSAEYVSPIGISPEEGKSYRIEVNSPEFGKASATGSMPKHIKVLQAFISNESYFEGSESEEWNEQVEITIEIEDIADEDNFYYATIEPILEDDSENIPFWNRCFVSSDPVFDEDEFSDPFFEVEEETSPIFCGGLTTFTDLLFKGERRSIKVYINKYELYEYIYDPTTGESIENLRDIRLVIGSMSQELYNYKRSAKSQYWNQDNPFAEPIRVYSNIEGGIGIFGGLTEESIILEL